MLPPPKPANTTLGRLSHRSACSRHLFCVGVWTNLRPQEKNAVRSRGVIARARGRTGLEEEQPDAYKDVMQVVGVLDDAGISRKVAKLRPVGVIKG